VIIWHQVTGVYGVAAEAVVLGGSTSLEQLAADTAAAAVSSHALRLALGLPPDTPLVPFFLAPDDMVPSATECAPTPPSLTQARSHVFSPGLTQRLLQPTWSASRLHRYDRKPVSPFTFHLPHTHPRAPAVQGLP
jgi:hypothetical protein